jgi:hypothetical protein
MNEMNLFVNKNRDDETLSVEADLERGSFLAGNKTSIYVDEKYIGDAVSIEYALESGLSEEIQERYLGVRTENQEKWKELVTTALSMVDVDKLIHETLTNGGYGYFVHDHFVLTPSEVALDKLLQKMIRPMKSKKWFRRRNKWLFK